MTGTELVWGVANLLYAGHDTTRYQLASCVRACVRACGRALAENEGTWEKLRARPDLVPAAVDEGCRYYPVVQAMRRVAHDDIVAGEWLYPAGTAMALNMLAASRYPEVFESPDDFLLPRNGKIYQPVYGRGIHRCIGHALARTEMIEALATLTSRFSHVTILGSMQVYPANAPMGGPEELHVRLSR